MRKFKTIIIILLFLALIASLFIAYFRNRNWTVRFKSELDKFFGEGNWEYLSEETKDSIIYTEYITVRDNPAFSEEIPGKFQNWYIQFNNKNNDKEIWKITNHTLKINNDKYNLFSPKRYSNKQAFVLELMDIACEVASEDVYNKIIMSELSEKEADCIDVSISYHGGNPYPEFYDKLFEESWFTVDNVSAENFLETDLHDFYLLIRAFDYKVKKLTPQEQENLFNSIENIEKKLVQKYDNNACFEIIFDKEHQVKYIDGIKQ